MNDAIMTIADEVLASLRQRPHCPLCGNALAAFWQKHQDLWCILHERPANCRLAYEEFGRSRRKDDGGTEEEAWAMAEAAISEATKEQI